MILNKKVGDSYTLYKKMIDMSIVYLIVISGFHLMFIKKITNLIFKKIPFFQFIFNFFLFFFYVYLLNFNASVLRVFLCLIISKCLKNKNLYDTTALSGIIVLLFVPSLCFSLSFQLSYICTFGVIFIVSLTIKSKILEKILINTCAVVISLPLVLSINNQISILAIINSFIFGYFFCFVFVYFFLT
ncbi:MAG: ComEC/Rec2 family competence protein [Mycoplasmoidaceae bacterium]|nr:ComEC/Rec2 family competence protein [Mycoplasmoidaceae bacterium]